MLKQDKVKALFPSGVTFYYKLQEGTTTRYSFFLKHENQFVSVTEEIGDTLDLIVRDGAMSCSPTSIAKSLSWKIHENGTSYGMEALPKKTKV